MYKDLVINVVFGVLLVSTALCIGAAADSERERPFQIGVLTDSWGPTPSVAGLRHGLFELGYRENKDVFSSKPILQRAREIVSEH